MVVKKKKFQSGFSPKTKSQPPAAAPSVYTALKTSIQDAPREKIFPLKKKKKTLSPPSSSTFTAYS